MRDAERAYCCTVIADCAARLEAALARVEAERDAALQAGLHLAAAIQAWDGAVSGQIRAWHWDGVEAAMEAIRALALPDAPAAP
jgi:hypothetical protein